MCCVRWISSSPADPYRGQERHEDGRRVFYGVTRIAKECVALRKYKVLEEIQSIHWGAEMYMESRVDGVSYVGCLCLSWSHTDSACVFLSKDYAAGLERTSLKRRRAKHHFLEPRSPLKQGLPLLNRISILTKYCAHFHGWLRFNCF